MSLPVVNLIGDVLLYALLNVHTFSIKINTIRFLEVIKQRIKKIRECRIDPIVVLQRRTRLLPHEGLLELRK